MTTETVRLRQSPSGKFIGDPPVRVGAGSTGVIARAQGSGSPQAMLAATAPISGLDAIAVDMQPGYLYELDLGTEILVQGLTGAGTYITFYQLRDKATGAWQPQQIMPNPPHLIPLTTGTVANNQTAYNDVAFNVSVTAPVDMVRFIVSGDPANAAAVHLLPPGCYARVTEYQP